MKILTLNTAAIKTQTLTQILRIKNEMNFLYNKKQQHNNELYYVHIQNTNT
jgi:hypothetical protein